MIKVLHKTDETEFEIEGNFLIGQGYRLQSSHCSSIPEPYDCLCFMGIFVKENPNDQ